MVNALHLLTPGEREASAMWDELRSALANFERVLAKIVETKAWEPLGYANFAEAWQDRMRGTRLATAQAAATVVYGLLDSGVKPEAVPNVLGPSSGVGAAKVAVLARQREHGVPPALATTFVRGHYREAPAAPHVVRVELTDTEYAHFKALCDSHGLDFTTEATRAVKAHFSRMERR